MQPNIPTGTITFLFTDIEGSTKLWESNPNEMNLALSKHDSILRQAIESNTGYVFKTVGDAFCAAFQTAPNALLAALEAQRALLAETWSTPSPIKVRMGLHTGEANERANDYFGPTLNRIARMFSAGHGGQTLLSSSTVGYLRDHLPAQVTLRDMGLHHFKDLNQPEQVFQLVAPDLPSEFAPLKSLEMALNNLLTYSTNSSQLIGRATEIEDLRQLLAQDSMPLVTLTGVGGTGKTRLSLAVARLVRSDFEHGVCFIPLETITQRQTLIEELVATLKIKEVAGEPLLTTLKTYLKTKQLLLVLDNFEQLVAQGATLLPELLKAAPKLKILVTSREILHLSQEHEYPVEPLTLPQIEATLPLATLGSCAAVALFMARAQAVKADFSLTAENALTITQICQKLDGLPLAIELAATRVNLLSPAKLLARLSDKLKLLTGGAKDLPARQQTLSGAIDWSYDLLDSQEQRLFRCLSIFAGGCTLDSIEEVCNNSTQVGELSIDILEGLTALSHKSLLKQREDKGGEIRFMMLPTIRDYGLKKLASQGELPSVAQAYAAYFGQWAQQLENSLKGVDQLTALAALDSEYANLREVLELNLPSYSLQLVDALEVFWEIRGYFTEGRSYLQKTLTLAVSSQHQALHIKALNLISKLAILQGDYLQAQAYSLESLAIAQQLGEQAGIAMAFYNLGNVTHAQGDYSQSQTYYGQSLAIHQQLDNKLGIAGLLSNLGNIANAQGAYMQAQAYYEQSLAIHQQLGNKLGIAITLNNLGTLIDAQGECMQAQAYYEQSLAIHQQLGNKFGIATGLNNLGIFAMQQGYYTQAQAYYEQSSLILKELGEMEILAMTLSNLGLIAIEQNQYEEAFSYLEQGMGLRRDLSDKWGICYSLVNFIFFAHRQVQLAATTSNQKQVISYLKWLACLAGAVDILLVTLKIGLQLTWAKYYEAGIEAARKDLTEIEFSSEFGKGQALAWEEAIDFALTIKKLAIL
jgi:predicted ATPase/class 3 adenylate cyclase/Tfp pilus assembly protein PilF